MRILTSLILILSFLYTVEVKAQETKISGIVLDFETGEPIDSVAVYSYDEVAKEEGKGTDIVFRTYTNRYGLFSFDTNHHETGEFIFIRFICNKKYSKYKDTTVQHIVMQSISPSEFRLKKKTISKMPSEQIPSTPNSVPPTVNEETTNKHPKLEPKYLILGGGAIASLTTALGFQLSSNKQYDMYLDFNFTKAEREIAYSKANNRHKVAVITLGVGIAAIVTGIIREKQSKKNLNRLGSQWQPTFDYDLMIQSPQVGFIYQF